ncbi:MAG: acyltransferase [SAR324 cluster bacterium]|nr:acyltransferase [SAR324 cluster bacterium]
MLSFLPPVVKGSLFFLLCALTTTLSFFLLAPGILLKRFLKEPHSAARVTAAMMTVGTFWAEANTFFFTLTQDTKWDMDIAGDLQKDKWYLVICNHQSWTDVMVLNKLLSRKVSFPKFFMKEELKWLPFFGWAATALDFPSMKRHSRGYLKKHPEAKGADLETTRKFCERFKYVPTTVFNFLEGTRYTPEKAKRQNTPYRHLLLPKAGGAALVFYSMGEYLTAIINVTIVYSQPNLTFWEFICGKSERIVARAELLPVPEEFLNKDYQHDVEFQQQFQNWINQQWQEKDDLIEKIYTHLN